MSDHKTEPVLIDGKQVDIDGQVVHIVKFLNEFPSVKTISSCQGDPGIIGEGGVYGHVFFVVATCFGGYDNYQWACRILFDILRPMFQHMYDDVRLGLDLSEDLCATVSVDPLKITSQPAYICMLHFRNEAIPEVERRLGVYLDGNFRAVHGSSKTPDLS